MMPSACARSSVSALRPQPTTSLTAPAARAASATEPPICPTPMTASDPSGVPDQRRAAQAPSRAPRAPSTSRGYEPSTLKQRQLAPRGVSSTSRQAGSAWCPSRSTKKRSRSPRRSVGREAMRRRLSPAAPRRSSTSASRPGWSSRPKSRLVASAPVGGRRRAAEHEEARDVGRPVVEARPRRRRDRRARPRARARGPRPRASSRASAAAAAADGAATIAAPPHRLDEPGGAARRRHRVRVDALDARGRARVREQRVRHLDDDLADDENVEQVRVDEVVERVRDQALGRLLDGDDAVVGAAPDGAEDLAQARRGRVRAPTGRSASCPRGG